MEVIRVEYLTKKFGKKVALDDVNLDVFENQITGLIGSNGAGKTTFLKCITGLLFPNSGKISLFGRDLYENYGEIMEKVGLLLRPAFYDYLTALENLKIAVKISNRKLKTDEIEEILKFVDLWEERNSPVSSFSFGMRQRLGLAEALISDPKLLILDEPTIGLDPIGTEKLKKKLLFLKKEKKVTILFSSHRLHQVKEICDRIILINNGSVLFDGPATQLGEVKEYEIVLSEKIDVGTFAKEIAGGYVKMNGNILILKDKKLLDAVFKKIIEANVTIIDVIVKEDLMNLFRVNGEEK